MLRRLALVGLTVAALLAGPPLAGAATASPSTPGQSANGASHSRKSPCQREFEETLLKFDEAFLDKDFDTFMSYYHKDATGIASNGTFRPTKADIATAVRGLMNTDFIAVFSTMKQVVEGCHTAVVISDFVLEIPAANFRVHFINNVTFIRDRGRWQVLVDHSTALPN